MSKYHKTVGGNFWRPEGSRFTAKFGIGTPPKNKSVSDTLPSRRGPEHNRLSSHLCMYVQKEYFSIFFGFNSSPNTIKQLDATFGSRRGAVSQQNSESAHRPKIKVFLTRYQVGVGLNTIDGVSHLCMYVQKEYFSIFFGFNSSPNTIKQLDATSGSRRGAVLQQNSESAHRPKIKVFLTRLQSRRGPEHNRWSSHLCMNVQKEYLSIFFLFEFVSKYHKTVGCNFWQPQVSRFTAKFGIGTPHKNKSLSDRLPGRRGPRPNRWSAHLGRNVEKE